MRFFLFFLLLLPCGTFAQKTGALSGRVVALERDTENQYASLKGLTGATVMLVTSSRDTLYRTTDRDGIFAYKQIALGEAVLRISFIGYQTRTDTVKVGRNTLLEFLHLKEEPRKIDEVVVTGKVPLLSVKGDTLVYHAAAVPVLEGDEVMRIVEQLPGAEVSTEGLKVQGERIVRSYVNGKLLFGDDALSVLNNLQASEVASIKVYDETSDTDRRGGHSTGRKQKVLDVVTKNPILSSVTGHFLASAGADIDKGGDGSRRLRYGVGTTDNFFSEMLLVSVNAFGNNIGRKSNRMSEMLDNRPQQSTYNEDIFAGIDIEKFWKDRRDGTSVKGGYSYTDNASEMLNVSRRRYFESASNPAMEYTDTTSSDTRRYSHAAYLNVDLHGSESAFLKGLSLDNKFAFDTDKNNSTSSMNTMTSKGVDYTNTQRRDRGDGYSIEEALSWRRYDKPMLPYVRLTARISKNTGDGWRVDSLSSTQSRRVLESSSGAFSQRYDWATGIQLLNPRRRTSENGEDKKMAMLSLEYRGSYEDTQKHKLALNLDDEYNPIDVTNTSDYTYHYLSHGLGANFGYGSWDGLMLFIQAGAVYSAPQKRDRFPVDYDYSKHFVTPEVSVDLNRSRNNGYFRIGLRMQGQVPSIEQITARIDDTNPLLLSAGNPRLKSSQDYSLSVNWNKTLGLMGQSVYISASAGFVENAVTTRSRFFAEPTYLPEWENYLTQANATLSTFENVNGNLRADFTAGYSFRIGRWATIRSDLRGNFSRNRAYVGEVLSSTDSYAPSFNMSWRGVISRKLRYGFSGSARYSFSENTVRNASRNLSWSCSAMSEYNPLKWLFGQVMYGFNAQRFYTRTGTDRSAHMLNATVGFKAFKGTCMLSVAAYDVLNKGTSFRSSMESNYVLDSWTPSFGRYYLVNVGVKFNRNQRGARFGGRLNDGTVGGYGGAVFL